MMESTNMQNLNVKFLILFRLHKNDKCVDLRIVNSAHFKTIKPLRFCHFCVVYNTKNFTLRFYTFVDFIIVYI
jgi:hypothetical protein